MSATLIASPSGKAISFISRNKLCLFLGDLAMMLNIYVMIQGQRVIMNMSPNRIIVTDAFLFVGSDRCEEAVWFCRAVTEEPQARMTMMTGSMSQAKTYTRLPAEDH